MSVVVRVPEGLYESARTIAALQGRQPGDLLQDAWAQYLELHKDQLAADFEAAAEMIRAGNSAGLGELASRTAEERAAAAADAARDAVKA
jgi:hypothetical protein